MMALLGFAMALGVVLFIAVVLITIDACIWRDGRKHRLGITDEQLHEGQS
jgi:hypothetical protein